MATYNNDQQNLKNQIVYLSGLIEKHKQSLPSKDVSKELDIYPHGLPSLLTRKPSGQDSTSNRHKDCATAVVAWQSSQIINTVNVANEHKEILHKDAERCMRVDLLPEPSDDHVCVTVPLKSVSNRTVFVKDASSIAPTSLTTTVNHSCSTSQAHVSSDMKKTGFSTCLNSTQSSHKNDVKSTGQVFDWKIPRNLGIDVAISKPGLSHGFTVSSQTVNRHSFMQHKSAGWFPKYDDSDCKITGVDKPVPRKRSCSGVYAMKVVPLRHFKHVDVSQNVDYLSKYSLRRQHQEGEYDSVLDVNRALGRSVSNLSRDKYKFINGRKPLVGSPRFACSKQTRLKLDRRRDSFKRSLHTSPLLTNSFNINRSRTSSSNGHSYTAFNNLPTSQARPLLGKASSVKSAAVSSFKTPPLHRQSSATYKSGSPRRLSTRADEAFKKPSYCIFYSSFGRCHRGDRCTFIHDPNRVSVCTRFLRGTCKIAACPFLHTVSKDRMPTCSYFLRGTCNLGKECPYLHVNVGSDAAVCEDFVQGCCTRGEMCKKKHILALCPEFTKTGTCTVGKVCKLIHRRKSKINRVHCSKTRKLDTSKAHVEINQTRNMSPCKDDVNMPFKDRHLPAYIALDQSCDTPVSSTSDICIDLTEETNSNIPATGKNNDAKRVLDNIHPQLRPISYMYSFP